MYDIDETGWPLVAMLIAAVGIISLVMVAIYFPEAQWH